jgi:hypothetical protein
MRKVYVAAFAALLLALAGFARVAEAQTEVRSAVSIRLIDGLSTGNVQQGELFTASLASDYVVNGRVVGERGDRVNGQVRRVVSSGRMKKPAVITLSLQSLETRAGRIPLQTGDLTIKADSHATRNLLFIGGSAGLGALIGAGAGGRGAAIGALVGGGAGAGGAYLTGKREIVLPSETLLTFHLNSVAVSQREVENMQDAARPRPQQDVREYPAQNGPSYDPYPVVVERRRGAGDDDDDEDYYDDDREGDHEHHRERYHEHYGAEAPRSITVIFVENHYAMVDVYWPRHVEHLRMHGDYVADLYGPLSHHTGFSEQALRARIQVRHDNGKHKGWDKGHGHGRGHDRDDRD